MQKFSTDEPGTLLSTLPQDKKSPRFLIQLLKNPFFIAYLVIYFGFLVLLGTVEKFDISEPLVIFLILGIGFSALAWWVTKGKKPLVIPVKHAPAECGVLLAYLVFVFIPYLMWGMNIKNAIATEPLRSLVVLSAKLLIAVVIPFLLFNRIWGYKIRDFVHFSFDWKKHMPVAIWISVILIGFQLVLGSGLTQLLQGGFGPFQLVFGIPFAFLWLIFEVGVMEEFFFRVLIQNRLSALFKSEIAGVVVMAVLFGLAHAPGYYFRAAELPILGASPSPLLAVGYSIIVVSVTGFFLGIVWARTKNLVVLVIIHAAGDLIPNMAEIIRHWFMFSK